MYISPVWDKKDFLIYCGWKCASLLSSNLAGLLTVLSCKMSETLTATWTFLVVWALNKIFFKKSRAVLLLKHAINIIVYT